MEGMSERAYAEASGISRGAVQKARKNGRLVLFADGSINAGASDARRGVMTDPDQHMRSRGRFGAGGDGTEGPASSCGGVTHGPGLSIGPGRKSQWDRGCAYLEGQK